MALFISHLLFYHARLAGVRPLLWANAYFPGYFYFSSNIDISSPVRRLPIHGDETIALRRTIESYVDGVTGDRAGPIYHFAFSGTRKSMLDYFRQRRGKSPLVLRPGWPSRAIQVLRLGRVAVSRLTFPRFSDFMTAASLREHYFYLRCLMVSRGTYDKLPPEFSRKNVFYPLQYEPEASLLYFAPEIVDQHSFVETILRSLPDDRILWVKEHPNQFGALGSARWRQLSRKYHNLRLIWGRESGRELIKRCALVVTISSTAGLDGLLMGRHVLVSGRVFYSGFSGVRQVSSYGELSRQIGLEANYDLRDELDKNLDELTAFGLNCYPGDPQPSQVLFDEENLRHLVMGIRVECARSNGWVVETAGLT